MEFPVTSRFALCDRHRRASSTFLLAVLTVAIWSALHLDHGLQMNSVLAATCPCTIWSPTSTPGNPADADGGAVELGVKFRSNVNGYVTGIRFYKGSTNTGTHVGNLWTSTGTLLSSVTFSNETASGWQQMSFASPVAITANTTYVASYHTNVGHYSDDQNYFATSGVTNGPLSALANGIDGGNGVYLYGATSGFPNQTWNTSNYWVDVVFTTSLTDTTPPTVTGQTPASGAIGVSVSTTVTATFSEAMDPTSISTSSFELRGPGNSLVSASVSYNSGSYVATLTPSSALTAGTTYTATVKGGTTDPRVKDVAGNALAANFTWSFTTALPPTQGPGGPILVVTSTTNPFTTYYAEILRVEGLNEFATADISSVTSTTLSAYDVVILGEMSLTSAQVAMFTNWVSAGGNLIAMRPDKQLANLLGLMDAGSTLSNGYLLVNSASGPGVGIVNQTIQFHGTADRYTLAAASSLATLYSDATTPTNPSRPAVTLNNVGSNGGQAAAFTYDLARSIVYTRQGNPAWAGQERDGFTPIRSDDLFYGAASADPQPDWVNLNKVAIPQADEQQRLLVNLILQMNADRKPLPRFWYFPRNVEAVVILTGDDHGGGGTPGRFNSLIADSPPGCALDNWECIRSTAYIYVYPQFTDAQAAAYTAQGFEVALHGTTNCLDWTPASLQTTLDNQLSSFRTSYPSVPSPLTHRLHCLVWSDYSTLPQTELSHGIRLDTNYYYWPPIWIQDRPGFFTGSGMPMRFTDVNGAMIDVYQATTQMSDESDQTYPFTINTLLDNAIGSLGYYGAFTVNAHADSASNPVADAVVASAQARGIPVVSAKQMLTWLDGRNASSFGSLASAGNVLSFTINVAAGTTGIQAMVPAVPGKLISGITQNGSTVSFLVGTIKGMQYAFFPATAGTYQVTFTSDTSPPTVTATSPVNAAVEVNPTTSITVTFSEAMNPATITGSTITLLDPSSAPVPATVSYNPATNTATLTPNSTLAFSTTYTITVQGGAGGVTDVAGNMMTGNFTSFFTTMAAPACPCTVFSSSSAPAIPSVSDTGAVELGMKFQSSIPGRITGIRFYKGAGNTGTHVGHLWSNTGILLGTVTFTNETASGWQQMNFTTPVSISANTTYVASYHTNAGHYADDQDYFAASSVTNGPLTALVDGADGGNGVYLYGASSGFPNQTWESSNYWVDIVFQP
jgi:hypothetical protein